MADRTELRLTLEGNLKQEIQALKEYAVELERLLGVVQGGSGDDMDASGFLQAMLETVMRDLQLQAAKRLTNRSLSAYADIAIRKAATPSPPPEPRTITGQPTVPWKLN